MIRKNINGFADSVTNSDPKNSHSTNQQHLNEMNSSSSSQDSSVPLAKPVVPGEQSLGSQAQNPPHHDNLGPSDSRR
jgi:hypothetical protein